ncbi:MAG: cyclic nucleotide-binding domain-containing protein [Scytonema sp. RU_4_4]|nr:cyclic nucleotide-binding domain-containing protein [Scytonema sp. RU_4_4]NJR74490.1 cyclic nucleotide-binding domain-containing protein [Scytonema sp. CRU_2_7]
MLHDPNQMTLFPKLPDDALDEMKQFGKEIQLNVGDVLFSEGDSKYHFYVVLEGEVEITKQVGAETKVLAIHRRGEFMGELSMLTGSGAIANAHAIAPSRVLQIDVETFRHLLIECSPIAGVILTAMAGRTKDVEAQLRQQEKMAALGKMSAGLAHELNNPGAAAQRAASQLRKNFQNLQTQALQLNLLSKEQLKFILTREYDCEVPLISAYGRELNQVWTNLIDNAIDAIHEQNGQIWIRTSCESDFLLVEIADNGPGIPPEVRSHIFEPFFTTKGVGEGTGLGLHIVYRIVVEQHQGDIRVLSQPGDTRFQVRLPMSLS